MVRLGNEGVCVLGSINQDVVAFVEKLPLPGETVVARGFAHFPGGKGANQAVAAARMGAGTLMIGAVGADEPGSWMRAFLQENGVDTEMVGINSRQPTGQGLYQCVRNRRECDRHRSGRKCRLDASRYPVREVDRLWNIPRSVGDVPSKQ